MNNRKIYLIFLSYTVSMFISACAPTEESAENGQLVIEEQGSFAAGGTVVTAPGTFDPPTRVL